MKASAFLTGAGVAASMSTSVSTGSQKRVQEGADIPVAILSHGCTVRHSEYSFISAARRYLVPSVQHELASDAPLSEKGTLWVGRRSMYERGAENIRFAITRLEALEPEANFPNLTLVGTQAAGTFRCSSRDATPVSKFLTPDYLRVLYIMHGHARILFFRSKIANRMPVSSRTPRCDMDEYEACLVVWAVFAGVLPGLREFRPKNLKSVRNFSFLYAKKRWTLECFYTWILQNCVSNMNLATFCITVRTRKTDVLCTQ